MVSNSSASLNRRLLGLWLMFTLYITFQIYRHLDDDDHDRRKEVLATTCDERATILQDHFRVTVNHLHALAILVTTFHFYTTPSAIDQETFAKYTSRTALERPLLSSVAYAQRVLHSDREEFERQHDWTISTMAKDSSPIRDEYAPVVFISQESGPYFSSFDMMSRKEDRKNILRARATGKAVLTPPLRLLNDHLGVVLTLPVYNYNLPANPTVKDRVEATAGYLGGAFDVESFVENLLGQLAKNQRILVTIYDITNASDPLIMSGSQCLDGEDMSFKHVSKLNFGDPYRKHEMICWYLDKSSVSLIALTTAFFVFVIGFLFGYMIYNTRIHIMKIEDDYHRMQELKARAEAMDVARSLIARRFCSQVRFEG